MFGILLLFLILLITSFAAGIVITLIVQWYFFNNYISKQPYVGPSTRPNVSSFELPQCLSSETSAGKEPAGAVNALLQFLFQECKNTKRVQKWFRHRLSLELEDLLTRTTTGKLFEKIVLRDLNLGSHLPAIRSIEVKELSVDSGTKLIEEVELCLDLDYSGGFQLSIDASMRLSKLAHVSVKVNSLSGLARLKFTRHPYTHWCFSFYSDPVLQLAVESQFQGRSLPQINSIIVNQIRKALKRNHTLPFYKIRYKPFFERPELDSLQDSDGIEPPSGLLELTILEVTRLTEAEGPIFCNVAIDNTAWIEMTQSGTASYLTVDVTAAKLSGQLGITFKQEFIPDKYQVCIVVDNVTNSLSTDLKSGDIVMLVEGKNIQTISALNKIIKQTPNKLLFRVERKLRSLVNSELKISEGVDCLSGLRNRGDRTGDKTDSDSSNPPSSSDSPAKRSSCGSPEHSKGFPRLSVSSEPELEINKLQVFTTKDVPYSKVISFNETIKINVLPEHRYLNLSLWTRGPDKNTLLGHISLPAARCCPPTVGHYISTFSLLPPHPNLANSLTNDISPHPGFEPCLCFGDVLLSFSFTSTNQPTPNQPASQSNKPPPPVTITTAPTPINEESGEKTVVIEHDFVRIHFEKVTHCDFCFKKIWLKDALQCQGCLMSCHKKCALKAQAGPRCARSATFRRPSVQPEIIMTSPEESSPQGGRTLSTLIANVATRGLKRAGSATSLAPPGMDSSLAGSISLPPSPNHSPSPSRKTSLVEEGLFSISSPNGDEINQALEQLLSQPHDEDVMSAAKASGKMLFSHLPPELRKSKIDDMMCKLKDAIDAESHNHQALQKEEQVCDNATNKAKVAFLVGKSEERLQALTVLMLHCCAGLQDYQDAKI